MSKSCNNLWEDGEAVSEKNLKNLKNIRAIVLPAVSLATVHVLDLSRASLHEVAPKAVYRWDLWIQVVLYHVKMFKY